MSSSTPASLQARYGTAPAFGEVPWNSVLDTLLAHRSVRAYSAQPLPPGTLETLVAAAQSAASSSNLQTWSVVAVTDPARKARLSMLAAKQEHIRVAPLFLVWLADLSRLGQVAERLQRPAEGMHYIETFLVSVIDAALAAQNAVVALESLGLGAVYIGAIRNHPEQVAAELGLPSHVMPVFGMCVGYPDAARPSAVKPRLPQTVVLHHEQYDQASQAPAIARYDEIMTAFDASQQRPERPWTERSAERWATPKSLHGRDRMTEALHQLGFELK